MFVPHTAVVFSVQVVSGFHYLLRSEEGEVSIVTRLSTG